MVIAAGTAVMAIVGIDFEGAPIYPTLPFIKEVELLDACASSPIMVSRVCNIPPPPAMFKEPAFGLCV